jgi:hypothetical protein
MLAGSCLVLIISSTMLMKWGIRKYNSWGCGWCQYPLTRARFAKPLNTVRKYKKYCNCNCTETSPK